MGKHGKARARDSAKDRRVAEFRENLRKKQITNKIRKWDDPVLSQVCKPVEDFKSIAKLAEDMQEAVLATKDGVGLAAPQLGQAIRVIVYRTNLSTRNFEVMVNPLVVEAGKYLVKSNEGCLSYPGYTASVMRPFTLKINYKTLGGADKTKDVEGREAVILGHELDHLEGICPLRDVWLKATGRLKIEEVAVENDITAEAFYGRTA